MSETELAVGENKWWVRWRSLQTFSFSVGWAVGVPAGALLAIAWGLWTNQGTYAAMEAKYTAVIAGQEALLTRVNSVDKVIASDGIERASVRDRITKLEAQISPVVVTSDVIATYGAHLGGLDAAVVGVQKRQTELQDQIISLCANLVGIRGASGKAPRPCP